MTSTAALLAPTTHTFQFTLPTGFRLAVRLGRCPALSKFGHLARSKKLARKSLTVSVTQLAATAILRHAGTPYGATFDRAIAKEIACWDGWLDPGPDGFLRLAQHSTGHSGRLTECTASLGEAIALYLAERMFAYPAHTFRRVSETDVLGMDFASPQATGEVALEAKARGRWSYKGALQDIRQQFGKRTSAVEKYGFILLYQQGAVKKNARKKGRKSHVRLVDPPGEPSSMPESERRRILLNHYYVVARAIGIWPIVAVLGAELNLPGPPSGMDAGYLARIRVDPSLYKLNDIVVHGRRHIGRFFEKPDPHSVDDEWIRERSSEFFFGLDREVFGILLGMRSDVVARLERYAVENLGGFSFSGVTEHGRARYAGLSDGILRVDVESLDQVLNDNMSVPPVIPESVSGTMPKVAT